MAIGTSLRNVARTLIEDFGNTADLYSYSGATKATDEEGNTTVSDWKTATSIKFVPTELMKIEGLKVHHGEVTVGSMDIAVKDNVTIAQKDKLTYNSVDYEVNAIDTSAQMEDTVVYQRIELIRM